jgi:outer membrane protein TolC
MDSCDCKKQHDINVKPDYSHYVSDKKYFAISNAEKRLYRDMYKKYLVLFTVLSAAIGSHAQVVFNSLEDIWKYADDHNVSIRLASYDAKKATYGRSLSYGALLPQISASGSFIDNTALQTTLIPAALFNGAPGVYEAVQFGQKYIYAGGIAGQLDIVNLQSWFNVQVSKSQATLSKDSLAYTRKSVYQQIASQYYSYLLMKEAARLAAQSESISDSVYQSIKNKFTQGIVNEANVDIARINLARAQQTNITSQYQMQTASNDLKGLLGMAVNDSIQITASLQNNVEYANDGAFAEDPSIKLSYSQLQVSIGQYRSYNSNYIPKISLLYSNTTQQNDNKFEPFEGGPRWYPAKYWTVSASWTIFSGGSRYFQTKRNKVTIDERRLQYENIVKQTAINDENTRLNYQKTRALLDKAQEVMNLSFDNYQHISDRYLAGIEPIENRLNAFNDYITYQNQYLNSLSDMLVQLYQVKIRQQSFK